MDNTVFIILCPDYGRVDEKVSALVEVMGGMGRFAAPGETLVLKPNLLQPVGPERAVTTHPRVVAAVGRLLAESGAKVILADSPGAGFRYTAKTLERVYRRCGMDAAAAEAGLTLNRDTTYRAVSYPDGRLIRRFEILTPVVRADGVINVCKFKTHLLMHMTGAVKNLFGVIPGLLKPGYHATLQDRERFAAMLLDLWGLVRPRLSVMDAVVGLEGEGPGATGTPRPVGLLLAAQNPLALDVVASHIMGVPRELNPLLTQAATRGLTPTRIEEVAVVGPDPDSLRIRDFTFPATLTSEPGNRQSPRWYRVVEPFLEHSRQAFGDSSMMSLAQRLLTPRFRDWMALKPRVSAEHCVGCGACAEACPMQIIRVTGSWPARIDESRCIRCYCCHEMCPHRAIRLHKSWVYRLLA